jgi:2-polyprenyl-6-methoxyphenol hydroxylase-like FAD-dependent oxidoreductase
MRVLISGAGIAGLSLGLCLSEKGHDVVICERSPALRDAGYMIDFFGPGYEAADRLALLPALRTIHRPVQWLTFVDRDGRTRLRLPYPALRERLFGGQHFNFMRGDLERVLYNATSATVIFGREINSIESGPGRVRVRLSDGTVDDVDLLVGADGIHSRVRALLFGPAESYLRRLGYDTAAFICEGRGAYANLAGSLTTLTVPGRQVGAYPTGDGHVAAFFIHRAVRPEGDYSAIAAREELQRTYGDLGWVVPRLLEETGRVRDIYFDAVAQVVMPAWSTGRVVLVGDAAYAVSLVAGQGASLALAGAFLLAQALEDSGLDVEAALKAYEARLRPSVERKQAAARSTAGWFVPDTQAKIALRDLALRFSTWPVASRLVRRQLAGGSLPEPA